MGIGDFGGNWSIITNSGIPRVNYPENEVRTDTNLVEVLVTNCKQYIEAEDKDGDGRAQDVTKSLFMVWNLLRGLF